VSPLSVTHQHQVYRRLRSHGSCSGPSTYSGTFDVPGHLVCLCLTHLRSPRCFTALKPCCLLLLQAVVSDVPTCGGVAYAKEQGIATLTYPTSKKGLFVGLSKEELVQQLTEQHQVDFVLLAGYLKVRLLRTQCLHCAFWAL
jgi:hypothetical protein